MSKELVWLPVYDKLKEQKMEAKRQEYPGVHWEIVDVSPDQAIEWLANQRTNRRVRPSIVTFYADQMKRGEWVFTPYKNPIEFDENGQLHDGQHRCEAVIEAGVTVKMNAIWGVPYSALEHTDDSLPRTSRDILSIIYGHNLTNSQTGAVKLIMQPELNYHSVQIARIVPSQLHSFLSDFPEVYAAVGLFARAGRVAKSPVIAAVGRAAFHVDANALKHFVQCLYSPFDIPREQNAVQRLAQWLMNRFHSNDRMMLYYTTEDALDSFVKRQEWGKMRIRRDAPERYSLPK